MKEISRRAMSTESSGMACGPMSIYAIDAEIAVEDDGKPVYLHTQWVDAAGDDIGFEATTESLYDCYEKLNRLPDDDHDAFEAEIANRDRIMHEASVGPQYGEGSIHERYAEQYGQLVQMMQDVLTKDGIDFDLLHLNDDDEDEEYDDADEAEDTAE